MDFSRFSFKNSKPQFPELHRVVTYLGFILALFSTSLFVFNSQTDEAAKLFAIILGCYIIIIAVVAIWREFVYSRKARYAEAMAKFHKTLHCLRDAFCAIEKGNAELSRRCIVESLSFFASAFSLITGVHCRSCIKTIDCEGDEGNIRNFYAETFERGSTPLLEVTEEPSSHHENDWIERNSDFFLLFRSKDNKFFSNDLSKEGGYQNTHWPDDSANREKFIKNREYDYISTIVWPIRSTREVEKKEKKYKIIGFLCIDAKSRGVFWHKYDVDAGAILADALYYFMEAYNNIDEPKTGGKQK